MDDLEIINWKKQISHLIKECLLNALANLHNKDTLLDDTEVAKILKVSKKTLPVWRNRGKGPDYVKIGSAVRYRLLDVQRYIETNVCKHQQKDG